MHFYSLTNRFARNFSLQYNYNTKFPREHTSILCMDILKSLLLTLLRLASIWWIWSSIQSTTSPSYSSSSGQRLSSIQDWSISNRACWWTLVSRCSTALKAWMCEMYGDIQSAMILRLQCKLQLRGAREKNKFDFSWYLGRFPCISAWKKQRGDLHFLQGCAAT